MEELYERFDRAWNEQEYHRLTLLSAWVFDFLMIHPFQDGNGRMSPLLATPLDFSPPLSDRAHPSAFHSSLRSSPRSPLEDLQSRTIASRRASRARHRSSAVETQRLTPRPRDALRRLAVKLCSWRITSSSRIGSVRSAIARNRPPASISPVARGRRPGPASPRPPRRGRPRGIRSRSICRPRR